MFHQNPSPFRISFLLLISLLLPLTGLWGCAPSEAFDPEQAAAEQAAQRYFTLWQGGDYRGAYALLSEKAQTTYPWDVYNERHTTLFSQLEVTAALCTLQQVTRQDDGATVLFDVAYTSDKLGNSHYDMLMSMRKNDTGDWRIQWKPNMIFPDLGDTDKVYLTSIAPARGEIFDRNGAYLAINSYDTTVYLDYPAYEKAPELQSSTLDMLVELLGMEREALVKIVDKESNRSQGMAILKAFDPAACTPEWEAAVLACPGIGIDNQRLTPVRVYPYRSLLAHFLGYVGSIPPDDVEKYAEKGYTSDARVGRSGLEMAYEDALVGAPGFRVDIYTQEQERKRNLYTQPAQNGHNLRLTIDVEYQLLLESQLATNLKTGQAAAGVLLEPDTGKLLAIASAPSYDLNLFTRGISQQDYDLLLNDTGKPLFNRAIAGRYPPGSTIKPFTAALGLQTGAVDVNYIFQGTIVNNQWRPSRSDWVYPPITRVKIPGTEVNMERALVWSDNVYFAYAIMTSGREAALPFFQGLGLDQKMPFELNIATSQISNSDYLDDIKLLADTGYGQGELLVSPLQMSATFAAFVNDGAIILPHIVDIITQSTTFEETTISTTQPEVWLRTPVEASSIQTIVPMLEKVVSDRHGTGHFTETAGLSIMAKTGTAQLGNDNSKEIGWFIGTTTNLPQNALFCVAIEALEDGSGPVKSAVTSAMFHRVAQRAGTVAPDVTTPPTTMPEAE